MKKLLSRRAISCFKELKKNTKFLDEEFPLWRKNKYITHKYGGGGGGSNKKLWIVRQFYRFHLFRAFLAVYSFMINKFKIDIKW